MRNVSLGSFLGTSTNLSGLKEYHRDYCVDIWSTNAYLEKWYVKCSKCGLGHYTSRKCKVKKCGGKLQDTIVNCTRLAAFQISNHAVGDFLHDSVLGGLPAAFESGKAAELCLVLGSSLTVPPGIQFFFNAFLWFAACEIPFFAKLPVVCNLQKTEYDEKAAYCIYATCDLVLESVLFALSLWAAILDER